MKEKYIELAHKMLEVCKGYKPIEALDALGNLYFAFVETQINEPMARILVYSEFINRLNEKIGETSTETLSEISNNTNTHSK